MISRIGQARGRPVAEGLGKCGAITRHSASVERGLSGRIRKAVARNRNTIAMDRILNGRTLCILKDVP